MTAGTSRWTCARGRRNASTDSSAPPRSPSPPAPCPPPEDSGPRSWSPSTTATCSPGSDTATADAGRDTRDGDTTDGQGHRRWPEPARSLPPGSHDGAHRKPALHRTRHRLHRPEDRLRRGHHPHPPRQRRPDPGHRPRLTGLPAAHPQSPHRPRPGLRVPRLHHPRHLVRSAPHHLLVPRRNNRHRKRCAALLTPPPRDPQRTLDHPDPHRHPLVHPATPPRPTPKTQTQLLLPPRRPRHRSLTGAGKGDVEGLGQRRGYCRGLTLPLLAWNTSW